MPDDSAAFVEALRVHFQAKNDKDLAAKIGVVPSKVSEWRSGKLGVTIKSLDTISEKTGLSRAALLELLSSKKPPKTTTPPRGSAPKRISSRPKPPIS